MRPGLLLPEGLLVAQAIKGYTRRWIRGVVRRVVRGTEAAVRPRLSSTHGGRGAVVDTAYNIERLQTTLRSRLAALARRTRTAVHKQAILEADMWLIGSVCNFCCWHHSPRFR